MYKVTLLRSSANCSTFAALAADSMSAEWQRGGRREGGGGAGGNLDDKRMLLRGIIT